MRNICVTYAQHLRNMCASFFVTCRTQVSSVKCQVDAIGNVQRSMFSFVPIDRLLVSRDYPSSSLFISNFRAHAHYSISISIDFTLDTLQSDGGYWLLVIGYWWGVKGDFLINNCLLCLYISEKSSTFGRRLVLAYYSMFALILQVGTCRALHSKCHPRHFFTPEATFAKCWTYYSVARNYFQKSATPLSPPATHLLASKLSAGV